MINNLLSNECIVGWRTCASASACGALFYARHPDPREEQTHEEEAAHVAASSETVSVWSVGGLAAGWP